MKSVVHVYSNYTYYTLPHCVSQSLIFVTIRNSCCNSRITACYHFIFLQNNPIYIKMYYFTCTWITYISSKLSNTLYSNIVVINRHKYLLTCIYIYIYILDTRPKDHETVLGLSQNLFIGWNQKDWRHRILCFLKIVSWQFHLLSN